MIITFCGHSNFIATNKLEDKLLSILNEYVGDNQADFYFGEYGAFDEFAFKCASKYKSTHPQVKLIFVTPYITEEYIRNRLQIINTTPSFIPKLKISLQNLQSFTEIDI